MGGGGRVVEDPILWAKMIWCQVQLEVILEPWDPPRHAEQVPLVGSIVGPPDRRPLLAGLTGHNGVPLLDAGPRDHDQQ